MRRNAFTILEVLVMSAIALVLLGVAWSIFSAMTRQSKKLDARLRSLQARQLVLERLKADIRQHVHVQGEPLVDVTRGALVLNVFREYALNVTPAVRVDKVQWTFDPDAHCLKRGDELLRFAQFESVSFSVKEKTENPKVIQNSVTVSGTWAPEELLATGRVTDRDRITFKATIAVPYRTLADAYPAWRENLTDVASR